MKLFRIMEIVWLLTALFAAGMAVYFLIRGDRDDALFFTFAFIISAIMYLLRRFQRKRQEKYLQQGSPKRSAG